MNNKKRLVLGVTGIRSEYDIMSSVFKKIAVHKKLELKLVVTGAHLSKKFGLTVNDIKLDNFNIADQIESLIDGDTESSRVVGMSIQIAAITHTVNRVKPDILLVLGDREESLATAIVGTYLNIPVAHIGGGDKVVGNIDDHVRHSVTKLAHIHFPTNEESKKRIKKLGEESFRIFNFGNPGLDRLKEYSKLNIKNIFDNFGFKFHNNERFLMVIQHPLSSEYKKSYEQMKITLSAVDEIGLKSIIIYPNSDAGSEGIIKAIDENSKNPNFLIFKNVPRLEFINLMRNTSCLIGNSSAGILEAPFLKLPVVNVGNRQKKRLHAGNVQFVPHKKSIIKKAVLKTLSNKYKKNILKIKNPYGDGKSSIKIANLLSKIKIDSKLLNKDITY